MLDDLGDVVDDFISSVTDFLHFSRPDKGPLRYYEEWMPHMMQGLAKGIHDNRYLVEDEIKSLANNISEFVNQPHLSPTRSRPFWAARPRASTMRNVEWKSWLLKPGLRSM